MSRREGSVYGGDPRRSAGPIQDPHFLRQHSAGPLGPAGPYVGPQPVAAHRTGFLGNSEPRSVSPFRPARRRTGLIRQSEPCSAGPEERAMSTRARTRAGPSEHSLQTGMFSEPLLSHPRGMSGEWVPLLTGTVRGRTTGSLSRSAILSSGGAPGVQRPL